MAIFKKILYHYLMGVLISASFIILIVLFDYYINGYLQYPELKNFIKVSVISGAGFGLTHFASTEIDKSNKRKTN
jgi:hypothetical protein